MYIYVYVYILYIYMYLHTYSYINAYFTLLNTLFAISFGYLSLFQAY